MLSWYHLSLDNSHKLSLIMYKVHIRFVGRAELNVSDLFEIGAVLQRGTVVFLSDKTVRSGNEPESAERTGRAVRHFRRE